MKTETLIRKTKEELVNIIIRKDAVERALRSQVKELKTINEGLEKDLSNIKAFPQPSTDTFLVKIKKFVKKFDRTM